MRPYEAKAEEYGQEETGWFPPVTLLPAELKIVRTK
jgi:hypothetical protein